MTSREQLTNLRFLRRASGRALLVGGMTLGLVGAATTVASAASPQTNNWYVSTSGSDASNTCTNSATPCATIGHAIVEQGLSTFSGTIHVAAGTYAETVSAGNLQDGVSILGAGPTSTIIEPTAAEISTVAGLNIGDTDSSTPQVPIVEVSPGTHGFKLKSLGVNGTTGIPALDTDGLGCGQDYIGIYYYESSGSINKVDVNGIDMPTDLFGCQGGQGIYVNSTSGDPATVTMTKVTLATPLVTAKTTAKLLAGSYTNGVLPVNAVPAGWHTGEVIVGGYNVSATKDGAHALFITGTIPLNVKSGSNVTFYASTPAFDKNGITCDDQYTTCTITTAVTQGIGPTNSIAQNGIQFFGTGSGTVNGSTVTGDTWTGGGGAGNAASGILVLNAGTVNVGNVTGNTVSGNDVNIYAGEVPLFGLATPPLTWEIANNTVSGATSDGQSAGEGGYGEGVQLDGTTNTVDVYNNMVTTSPQANFLLLGVTGAASIGGASAGEGNTSIGSTGAGMVLGGPDTNCEVAAGGNVPGPNCNFGSGAPGSESAGWATHGIAVTDNTFTQNAAGVVVEGAFAPTFQGLSPDPNAAYFNTLDGNQWSGADTNTLAGVADFSGNADSPPAENSYSAATANSCAPSPGGSALVNAIGGPAADVTGNTVTATSAIVTNSANYPATVLQGALVHDVTTPANIAAGTYVGNVSGMTLTLSQNAAGSGANDELDFFNRWAC